ncbi:MAG: hypothetical protein ABIZ07_05320, partial [Dermatophilaceae bacterium]
MPSTNSVGSRWLTLVPIVRGDLVRLAAAVTAAVSLAVALGLIYSVQRELNLAPYSRGLYDTTADVMFVPSDVDRVLADFGPDDTFLGAWWQASIAVPGSSATIDADVIMTLTPHTTDVSFFPAATRVDGPAAVGDDEWIDLDAALARALGVGPGDAIEIPTTGGARIPYTVRSVHAQRLDSRPYSALASAVPAFRETRGTDEETMSLLMVRGKTGPEVATILAQPFYQQRLHEGKLEEAFVTSRSSLLESVSRSSSTSIGMVLVLAVLALAGGIGMAAREIDVFGRRYEARAALLYRLGMPGRESAPFGLVAVTVVVTAALAAGGVVGSEFYTRGVLAPTLPPST